MKCPHCSFQIPEEVNFCGQCGRAIDIKLGQEQKTLPLGAGSLRYEAPSKFVKVFTFRQHMALAYAVQNGDQEAIITLSKSPLSPFLVSLGLILLGILRAVFQVFPPGLILYPVFSFLAGVLISFIFYLSCKHLEKSVSFKSFSEIYGTFFLQHPYIFILILPFQWSVILFLLIFFSWGNYLNFLGLKSVFRVDSYSAIKLLTIINILWIILIGIFIFLLKHFETLMFWQALRGLFFF
ncbi:zinc ribbon domain-containing protein [Candidatus Riflebacteria bacterium]